MKNVCSYTENTTVHMVTIVEDLSSHLVNTLFRIRVCVKHERFSNDTGLMLFTVMLAWSIMKKRFIYIYIFWYTCTYAFLLPVFSVLNNLVQCLCRRRDGSTLL